MERMTLSIAGLLLILLWVGYGRLKEVRLSWCRIQQAQSERRLLKKEPAFVLMVMVHLSLFILVPLEVIVLNRPWIPWLSALGLLLLAGATGLRIWVLRTLGSSWNVRVLLPPKIVSEGPYRYIRHPNYVVVILELMAIPLLHTAWMSALFLTIANAMVLSLRIPREEQMLFTIPEYEQKMRTKPRFIPKIFFK